MRTVAEAHFQALATETELAPPTSHPLPSYLPEGFLAGLAPAKPTQVLFEFQVLIQPAGIRHRHVLGSRSSLVPVLPRVDLLRPTRVPFSDGYAHLIDSLRVA